MSFKHLYAAVLPFLPREEVARINPWPDTPEKREALAVIVLHALRPLGAPPSVRPHSDAEVARQAAANFLYLMLICNYPPDSSATEDIGGVCGLLANAVWLGLTAGDAVALLNKEDA